VKPTVVCSAHPGPPDGFWSLVPQSRPSIVTKTCEGFAQIVNCRPGPASPKLINPVESKVGVFTPDSWSNIETALEQSSPSNAEPETN
jgi:hypothetical protein